MDSASTPPKQSTQPASSTGPPPAAASGVQKRYRAAPAKTFQCRGYGECRMVFSRSEHLARHIRKHTGERPFACHCGKQFSRLDNLRQHAQTVHSDKHAENEAMMRELTSLHTQLAANSSKANRDSVSVSGSNRQPSAASGPNPGNDKIGGRQSHSPHPPYDHHPSQPQFSGGPTGPSVPQLGIPIGYHTYQPHVTGYPPHHPPPSPHFPHPGSPDQYPHHPAAAGYYPHPPGQPNQGYGSPAYPPAYPHYPAAPGSVRYAPYPSPYPHGQYPPGSTLQPGPYSAGGAQQPSSPSTSAPASTSSPAPHTPLTPNPTQVAATAGPGHSFLGPTASPRGAGASGQPFLGRGGDSGSASPHPNSAVDGQSFRAQQSTTNGDHSGDPSPSPSSAAPAGTAGGPTSPANGQYGINGNGIHGGKSSPSSPGSGSGYDQQQQQHAESGAATNGVEQGFREREGATPIIRASAASGRNHRYAAAASRENQSESNDGCQQQQQFFDGEGDGRGITKRRRELGHQEGDEREISTSAVDPRYRPTISTSSSTIHAESGISSRFPQVTSNAVPHQQQHFRDFNGASSATHGGFGASEQHSFQSASNSHPKREIFTPGVHSQFQQQTVVPPVFTGRGPDEHFRGGSSFQQQQSKPFQSGYPGNGIVSGGRFDGSATGGPPQSFPDPGYNNGLRNGMGYSEGYHGGSDVNNSNNSSFVGQQYPASTASAVDGRPRSSRSFLSGGFGFNLQHQQSQLSQSQDNDSPFSFHPPPEDASGVVFGLSRTLPRPTSSGRPLSSSGFIRPFSSGGIGSTGGRPFSSSGRPPSSSLFRPFSSGGGAGFGFGFGFGGSRPGTGGSTTDPASYAFSRGVKRPYTAGSDGGGANGFGNSATTGGTTGVGGREYADGSPFRFAIGGPLPSTRNAANDDANADERPQSRRLSVMELCTPPASAAGRQSQQFQRIGGAGDAASARPTTSEGSTRWSGNTLVADEGEDELSDGREIDVDVVTESEPSRSEFTSSQTANEETARTPAFHGELDETQSKASHVYSDSFVSFERGQQQRRSEHFESGTDDGSRRVVDGFQLTQPTIYETAAETAPSSAVDESFGNASLPGADYAQSSRERFISNHGLSSESIQSAADIRSGHFAVGSAASSRLEPQHTIVRPSSTPAALFGLKSEEQLQSVFPAVTGPGAKSASPGPTRPRSFVSGPDVDGEFQLQQLQQQQFGVDVKSGTVFCADNMGGGSHSRRSSAPRSSTNAAPSTPTSSAASESGPARGSATVIGLGAGI